MIAACQQTVGADASLLERLTVYVECRAESASQAGFDPLYAGAFSSAALTIALTIYVALIGYQMMLGRQFGPRDLTLACLRAGLVIAFASSWASYQTVIQKVVMHGPAQLSAVVLQPARIEFRTPLQAAVRIQEVHDEIRSRPLEDVQQAVPVLPAERDLLGTLAPQALPPPALPKAVDLDIFNVLLLFSAGGASLSIFLCAGLLLAFGPLIIPFALFDTTLGVVEGWIRALLTALFSAAVVMVIAAFEFDFIESELFRSPGGPMAMTESDLDVISAFFGAASWMAVIATALVARGFRFRTPQLAKAGLERSLVHVPTPSGPLSRSHVATVASDISRAQSVADAVTAQGRREQLVSARVDMVAMMPKRDGALSHGAAGVSQQALAPRRTPAARRLANGSQRRGQL